MGGMDEMDVDRTGTLDSTEPTTPADFERLLLGEPNSSYLWIRYMALYLQTSDVAKAREIAQRALKVIHFREEDERLNVWVAILNLENAYGSAESLEAALVEAFKANDDKQVYVRAAELFAQSGKYEVRCFPFGQGC